ncbi:MAG: extracellular solute-binding protein [Eubacteriales bacterium]|nr:extracellular solute-binding protein [Eubacteriales bacterium]MDD4422162.1 extracellular solute-binding protein [Eubacteriales bacterium]
MKKLFCFLLLIAIFSTMLFSCDTGVVDNKSTDTVSKEESKKVDEFINEQGRYTPRIEYKDWEERTFNILVRGEAAATYQSEDFTTNSVLYGDNLNKAVLDRNNYVQETYNVVINPIKSDTINQDFANEALAMTGAYDAIMPTLASLARFAQDGYLYDLNDLEYITLEAPWYDKNANDAFSIQNKLFFTTGDITILNKVCTPSVLFNKQMITDLNLDNPYELVNNHEWTFDKMVQMAKQATMINTTDGSISKENRYGMLSSYADGLNFFGSAGQKLCSKDADDLPYLSIGTEESINIAQKILETMRDADWLVYAQKFEDPIWVTSFATFLEGRALFRPSGFSATTKARQQSLIEFGILPTPLWNEDQEDYYSYCGSGEVAGIAVPLSAPDPDFSAYMVEVCSAEAKNTITKAYMEVNLQAKDVRDDESLEMLEIIFDNIVYDVGEVYNFGGVKSIFYNLTSAGSADIVSELESIRPTIESEITTTIENYSD